MVSYESTEKVLFSADAFGKFGALDADEDWACEARRYYFNIVGKYGAQAAALLKKAAGLDIQKICPLHGQFFRKTLPIILVNIRFGAATKQKMMVYLLPMHPFMEIRQKQRKNLMKC